MEQQLRTQDLEVERLGLNLGSTTYQRWDPEILNISVPPFSEENSTHLTEVLS